MDPQEGMYNLDWANLPLQRAQSSQPTSPTSSAMNGHLAREAMRDICGAAQLRQENLGTSGEHVG